MRKEGNIVIADEGKSLRTPIGIFTEVPLGISKGSTDGEAWEFNLKMKDIEEVTPVRILDDIYYTSSSEYGDIVTDLIRCKYSLDQELALYANSFLDPDSFKDKMNAYQEWRSLCKEAAKKICNE